MDWMEKNVWVALSFSFLLCHHFGINKDRELTMVRKDTIEFLGCFNILKHHCLLSAFKRSSVSNKNVWPFWANSTPTCSIPEIYAQLLLAWVLLPLTQGRSTITFYLWGVVQALCKWYSKKWQAKIMCECPTVTCTLDCPMRLHLKS